MNILITICARGGSKGIPKKNIRKLNGKHLIAYTIQTAFAFQKKMKNSRIDVELSTDSEEIKEIAAQYDLSSEYIRPSKFATDKAGKVIAIEDVLKYTELKNELKYDYVLDMDVTAPLRTVEDLEQSLELIKKNKDTLTIFSVSLPHRNPYFNMVECKEDGYVKLVKPLSNDILSRQTAPKVYDMNASFYFYRRTFFDSNNSSVITDKSLAFLMNHICFDIDNMLDFEIMDFLLRESRLDFEF